FGLTFTEIVEQALGVWEEQHNRGRVNADLTTIPDKVSLFIHLARQISEVQLIYQEGHCAACGRIWTVIDAPPFDEESEKAVYTAQFTALQDGYGPPPDFGLLNIREAYPNIDDDQLY